MTKLNIGGLHKQTSIIDDMVCSLIDVCLCIFSSVISSHCIVFFFVICVKSTDVTFIY